MNEKQTKEIQKEESIPTINYKRAHQAMGRKNQKIKGHDFSNGKRFVVEEREYAIPKGKSKYDFEKGVDLVITDEYDISEKMDEEASQTSLEALLGKVALNCGDITLLNQRKILNNGEEIFDETPYADQANDMPDAMNKYKQDEIERQLAEQQAAAEKKAAEEAANQANKNPLDGMSTEDIEKYLQGRKEQTK